MIQTDVISASSSGFSSGGWRLAVLLVVALVVGFVVIISATGTDVGVDSGVVVTSAGAVTVVATLLGAFVATNGSATYGAYISLAGALIITYGGLRSATTNTKREFTPRRKKASDPVTPDPPAKRGVGKARADEQSVGNAGSSGDVNAAADDQAASARQTRLDDAWAALGGHGSGSQPDRESIPVDPHAESDDDVYRPRLPTDPDPLKHRPD